MASVVDSSAGITTVDPDKLANAPAGEESLTDTEVMALGVLPRGGTYRRCPSWM